MFFYIIHKLPVWTKMKLKNRNARVFLMGIIWYVILHSFLYSKYFNDGGTMRNYRKYIYYVLIIDIIITSVSITVPSLMKKKHRKRKYIKWNKALPNKRLLQYNYQNPQLQQDIEGDQFNNQDIGLGEPVQQSNNLIPVYKLHKSKEEQSTSVQPSTNK